jgi:hypothetical protein
MSATMSGLSVAPAWSKASFRPKTHPRPIVLPAWESIDSIAGRLMARPVRSATISTAAAGQFPASARAGTAGTLMP